MREVELIRAVASGVGNPIIAVGARTGRDGIHGASFASEDLSHESDAKRPRVQVGDPFTEKLLLEASLELIRSGHIVAIQDMGAAGLTSSSAEMAARGDVGVEIDVTRMPLREEGMTPYEILLSESQERMLVVALKGRESQVQAILAKWDLAAEVIGAVIAEPVYRVKEGDRVVAEFPGSRLVTDCPVYYPEARESDAVRALREQDVDGIAPHANESDAMWTLERLLTSPTIASKAWIVRQYDSTVRASTIVGPGPADAAVVMLRGTKRALALKADCNGRYVYLDPRTGGRIAVAEAARNVACAGGRPMAITNCLNFGNPRKPDVFFQFREAVAGMGEACVALGTPVTGGNVSFYNESPLGAVYPTPTIGMVGLLEDVAHATTAVFRTTGNSIILLGENTAGLGASEYLRWIHNTVAGRPPACDLNAEARLIEALLEALADGTVESAHDCSDGGIAVALAECCVMDEDAPIGASVDLTRWSALPLRALLFGEAQGRIVVSTPDPAAVLAIAGRHGVPANEIGRVGEAGGSLSVRIGKQRFESPVSRLRAAYHGAIPAMMAKVATATDEDAPALAGRSS
jgi:phosphoribosylformylglycinamidine synthase